VIDNDQEFFMITLQTPLFKKIETQAQSTPGCISFSQGALRVGGVPGAIREYVREVLTSDKADYYVNALGLMSLRERVAKYLLERHGAVVDPRSLFISHGSIGGLTTCLLGLLQVGDEVVLPAPTYPVYQNIVKMARAVPVFVQAMELKKNVMGQSVWTWNLEKVKASITPKTKMIIIANPSNPTGMALSKREIQELAQFCQEHKIYLMCDEVYEHFVFEGDFYSATELVAQYDYVIRLGSFSKNFAMSGWRVGFVVVPQSMMDLFAALQGATVCCPSTIGQHAALYALDHPEVMQEQFLKVKKARDYAYNALAPLVQSYGFEVAYPSASFYLFVKTPEVDSTKFVFEVLEKAQVALAPGADFGPFSSGYFRLCYAREFELVQEGLTRLVRYVVSTR